MLFSNKKYSMTRQHKSLIQEAVKKLFYGCSTGVLQVWSTGVLQVSYRCPTGVNYGCPTGVLQVSYGCHKKVMHLTVWSWFHNPVVVTRDVESATPHHLDHFFIFQCCSVTLWHVKFMLWCFDKIWFSFHEAVKRMFYGCPTVVLRVSYRCGLWESYRCSPGVLRMWTTDVLRVFYRCSKGLLKIHIFLTFNFNLTLNLFR